MSTFWYSPRSGQRHEAKTQIAAGVRLLRQGTPCCLALGLDAFVGAEGVKDSDDCTRLATGLIERGDVALPEDVLVAALKANDPYDYGQPLDLDAYTAKYIQKIRQAAK